MLIQPTEIPDVIVLASKRHGDARGYFLETFRRAALDDAGIQEPFVQDNESLSAATGTLRGLHFQIPPRAQGKLVRVVRGSVLDVAVDLRRHSASYGRHVAVELSAENARQLWVPAGFAHGVCTLEPDTILAYKVTDYWSPDHERTLRFNDPELKIPWPVSENEMTVNARDRDAPLLQDLEGWF